MNPRKKIITAHDQAPRDGKPWQETQRCPLRPPLSARKMYGNVSPQGADFFNCQLCHKRLILVVQTKHAPPVASHSLLPLRLPSRAFGLLSWLTQGPSLQVKPAYTNHVLPAVVGFLDLGSEIFSGRAQLAIFWVFSMGKASFASVCSAWRETHLTTPWRGWF